MKLAIASIFLAILLSGTEARIADGERRLKSSKSSKSSKSVKSSKKSSSSSSSSSSSEEEIDPARQALIGDCTMLTGTSFEVETGYDLTENTVYTYPCSGSYLRFYGSNVNLQADVFAAINKMGKEMGSTADCANLCDIDNGSYDTVSSTGMGTIEDFANSDILCAADSPILENDDFEVGANGESQCRCDPDGDGYKAGCAKCMGTVSFSVGTCLDTSAFAGSTAAPVEAPDTTAAPVEAPDTTAAPIAPADGTRAPVLPPDDD